MTCINIKKSTDTHKKFEITAYNGIKRYLIDTSSKKLVAVILNRQFMIVDRIIEKAYSFLNNKIMITGFYKLNC